MNIIFMIGSAIIFFLGWLYVKNYILTPYITKKTGVTKLANWPPSNSSKCPDYWTNTMTNTKTGSSEESCVQSSALKKFYKNNSNLKKKPPYLKTNTNHEYYYTMDGIKKINHCSNPDSVDCKCALARTLCTPWSGITDMSQCSNHLNGNCHEGYDPENESNLPT